MTKLTFTMRQAGPADAADIHAFVRSAYARWVPLLGREPLPMTADYEAALRDHRIDLMSVDGRLAGLIETEAHPDHLFIVNVAIAPDLQGQRLGHRLLAFAEGLAAQGGLAELRLFTNAGMTANIGLYRRLGYAVTAETPMEAAVRVEMRKPLRLPARRVLFLPGASGWPAFWRPLGERLPAAWTKTYLGWPGLGDQPADPGVTSWSDLVDLAEAQVGDGPVDLVAQSMGGWIAMQLALRRPDAVRRLVLSVTSAGVDMAALGATDWRTTYRAERPQAAGWITEDVALIPPAQLAAARQPTLLLWEDADPISPLAVGETLLALLSDAALHVTPASDHDHVHRHPEALAPLVAAHLLAD